MSLFVRYKIALLMTFYPTSMPSKETVIPIDTHHLIAKVYKVLCGMHQVVSMKSIGFFSKLVVDIPYPPVCITK